MTDRDNHLEEQNKILSQILSFGITIPILPFNNKFGEFVHESFMSIKHVNSCIVSIKPLDNSFGDLPIDACENCICSEKTYKYQCLLEESRGLKVFKVGTFNNNYGFVALKLNRGYSDKFITALYNFCALLATTIENHLQKNELKDKNFELIQNASALESLINERTSELLHRNETLTKSTDELVILNEKLKKEKEKAEESDRLKTEFINNMSHEILTPMNGILGFSSLLLDEGISNDKLKSYVDIIQNSGNQLLKVIDDILEISRLETKQVKVEETEICLNDFLLNLFSTYDKVAKDNKTPLYFKKALSDKQSTIFVDEDKLHKILSHILENALKFTFSGSIELGYKQETNNLEIYVKDTGIGIDPDKQEVIFERFSQAESGLSRNAGGLGLGLSIAKENVELIGGEIKLESKKGKGSTFFISIPYKAVHADTNVNNLETTNRYTILVAEDEEVNYLLLELLLRKIINTNCKIMHAPNGEEAVKLFKENTYIDLVLMDLKMPIIDGFTATKKIRELNINVPIVALSAYTSSKDKEEALSAGCNAFITKPIDKSILEKMLNTYLL